MDGHESKRGRSASVEPQPDGSLLIRIVAPVATAAGSPLVALEELGLEKEAARRLRESGELLCAKIGRKWYAKRVDVEAMFDRLAEAARAPRRVKPIKLPKLGTAEALAKLAAGERRVAAR